VDRLSVEAAAVGALLVEPALLDDPAFRQLKPEHFEDHALADVFREILRRHNAGEAWDGVLLASSLGPVVDWTACVAACPSVVNGTLYAAAVIDGAQRRRLSAVLLSASSSVSTGADVAQALADVRAAERELRPAEDCSLSAALADLREYREQSARGLTVLPTGLRPLDKFMHGFSPGRLYVLAGRPGTGKTTLACNIFGNLAVPALFVSLELPRHELLAKLIAAKARRPLSEVLEASDYELPDLSSLPLRISGEANTVPGIASLIRPGDRLVVVDQLSFLTAPDYYASSAFERAAEIVHRLKRLARDRRVAVLLLAQLNRDKTKRGDRPKLSDLKMTGALEEDADAVILLDREAGGEELFCDLAKQRHGPEGSFSLKFYGSTGVVTA